MYGHKSAIVQNRLCLLLISMALLWRPSGYLVHGIPTDTSNGGQKDDLSGALDGYRSTFVVYFDVS